VQILSLGGTTAQSNSSTNYAPVSGTAGAWTSTQANNQVVAPTGGKLGNLRVVAAADPGGSASWAITIEQNGTPSSLTCTINAGSTTCQDTNGAHDITVSAGDRFDVKSVPTNTPAAGGVRVSLLWKPTTANEMWFPMTTRGTINTTAAFLAPMSGDGTNTSDTISARVVLPIAGSVKSLYTWCSANVGASASRIFTVQKNGSATGGMTCTQGTGTATCNDTSTSPLSLAVGDQLNIAYTLTGTPGAAGCGGGLIFVPTTSGQFVWMHATSGNTPTTATDKFAPLQSINTASPTTEDALTQRAVQAATVKTMYVKINAALGAGSQVDFTLNNGAGTATALTCSISGGSATTCTTTTDVTVTDDNLLDTVMHHSGSTGSGQNAEISYGAVFTGTFP
jgi:hypothetical protein